MSKITGHCLCGSVHFATEAEPVFTANCHCTECRRATGAVYATMLFFKRDNVQLTGETKSYSHKSDRGTEMTKHFCPDCGSPIFTENSARQELIGIRAGSIVETDQIKPQRNVFISSKIGSTPLDPSLPASERMPTG